VGRAVSRWTGAYSPILVSMVTEFESAGRPSS
jgi:hypothetical protein